MKRAWRVFIPACILLAVWEMVALAVGRPALFPSVFQLLKAVVSLCLTASFYQSVAFTVARGMAGIVVSLVAAVGLAFLFVRCGWLYGLFRPLLSVMRSIPVISFILLALLFFHTESIPLIIAFLVMFPLLTENLAKGFSHLRPGYTAMAGLFRIGRKNRLLQVYYPQLNPFLYSGLASAMGFGWRAVIMGEVLAQCRWGIGGGMKRAQVFIDAPEVMAWTVVAILAGFLFDSGIRKLERVRFPLSFRSPGTETPPAHGVRISGMCFSYRDKPLFSGFTQAFEPGVIYGVSAPSGAGKTTLLNLINGLLKPDRGMIEVDRSRGIAAVFQEPELLPHLTVRENIMLPLARFYAAEETARIAGEVLDGMEIGELKGHYPGELSYGQQQRAAIARALAFPSPL
ncbi:MAG: ATP-binding cassette domain-containing protein, partial [Tannerellaceae bacterium]|nr:ATP-binding cassette domain-containing protein [Tannerellaceae bacterium]